MKWGVGAALVSLFMPVMVSADVLATPSCVLSTPPGTHYPGDVVRLIWYSENAAHAFLNNGIGEVPLQGFRDISPSQSTMYVMTVKSDVGVRTCAVQVSIMQIPNSSVLYQPSALPIALFPNQVYWAPVRAPYSTKYYDDGYDWYIDSPYMKADMNYLYVNKPYDTYVYQNKEIMPGDTGKPTPYDVPQNPSALWVPDTPESVASPDSPLFDPPFGPTKPGTNPLFGNSENITYVRDESNHVFISETPVSVAEYTPPLFDLPDTPVSPEVQSPLMGVVNNFSVALQPDTYFWSPEPAPVFSPGVETYTYYPENSYEPQLTQTQYNVPDETYYAW